MAQKGPSLVTPGAVLAFICKDTPIDTNST